MKPYGKEHENIMRSGLFAMLAALVLAGCMAISGDGRGTYKVYVANRSNEVLQEVIIRDADGEVKHLGNVDPGSEKLMDDCAIDLKNIFGIGCYANGHGQTRVLNLNMYFPVKNKIKTFCFYYSGGNQWSVVARDAAANEVKLDYKAAEQGDAKAQVDLGICYCNGDGVPQDYTKAVKWFRKAAEQGNADGQYRLGVCCYGGMGVPERSGRGRQVVSQSC